MEKNKKDEWSLGAGRLFRGGKSNEYGKGRGNAEDKVFLVEWEFNYEDVECSETRHSRSLNFKRFNDYRFRSDISSRFQISLEFLSLPFSPLFPFFFFFLEEECARLYFLSFFSKSVFKKGDDDFNELSVSSSKSKNENTEIFLKEFRLFYFVKNNNIERDIVICCTIV